MALDDSSTHPLDAMNCSECGQQLTPQTPGIWRRVVGWEKHREKGGTNHIALREPLQEWLCATCMVRKQHGTQEESLW